ncbi:MAG TPA: hypothetical protein VIF62_21475 [Labilithrix sp.]|jgi:hypothetical protein
MPLDEATNRFAFLMQRDLRRLADREAQHAARGEEINYDSVSRLATFETMGGNVSSRHFGEILATYSPDDRIFRWAWAGRAPSSGPTHSDLVFREGQQRGVPQLTMSVIGDLDEIEAAKLARLGGLVARADALYIRRKDGDLQYIGLFERPRPAELVQDARMSVPPPPVSDKPITPVPRRAPYRSLPPIREVWEPRTSRPSKPPEKPPEPPKIREPARAVFLPAANLALVALARSVPGYRQGLYVITIDEVSSSSEKRRLVVQLVALDAMGHLRALDPPQDLLDATAQMIDGDRKDGNGPWRKLSARIIPKPDGGATLHVDVV